MFTNFKENQDAAAIIIENDPIAASEWIQKLVSQGDIVRTRADAGTIEARNNDDESKEKAFFSGAKIITADYSQERNPFGTEYKVAFPNGYYIRSKLAH